jgi:hypothetical protein
MSSPAKAIVGETNLIDIRLDGPDVIGTGVQETYTLRMSYAYPERVQNFSYTVKLTGDNTTGSSISPTNGTAKNGVFTLKVTAPSAVGKFTVQINATADEGRATWFRVEDFELEAVKPVYVNAVLMNSGSASLTNASVKMLVDGVLKRTEFFNISSGQSIQLNFTWVFSTMSEGKHTITLIANDDTNTVEFSTGDNVLTIDVYYSTSGNLLRGILGIMTVFVAIILVMTFLQKKPSAKGK